jgi:hypothetical protein
MAYELTLWVAVNQPMGLQNKAKLSAAPTASSAAVVLLLGSRNGRSSGLFCGNGIFLDNRPGRFNSFFGGTGLFLGNRPGRSNGFQIV